MKLSLITRYEPFRTMHGTEVFAKNLSLALVALGHDVHLVFGTTPAHLVQPGAPAPQPGFHTHLIRSSRFQTLREVEYLIKNRFILRRLLDIISPDVAIAIGAGQGSIFSDLGKLRHKCMLVYYAIDCMAQEGRAVLSLLKEGGASLQEKMYSRARYFWLEQMDVKSCGGADLIVATSRDTKMNLSKYYKVPEHKVKVNYLGIPDDYTEGLFSSYPEIPTFLHVATRHDRKGTRYLLDALRILRARKSGPVRTIIRGSKDPYYVSMAERLDVRFVTQGDLRPLYASCTALVVPSVAEGFCLPVVEAAAFGKPAIVFSAGSLPELVLDGESGYVVAVGNTEKLAERMRELCESPSLVEKMGKRARDISQRFTVRNSAQNLLGIIQAFSRAIGQPSNDGIVPSRQVPYPTAALELPGTGEISR